MKARVNLAHLPPSVNAIWRHKKNGQTYRTSAYMTWQNGEGWNVKAQLPGQPKFTGPVYITCAMKRPNKRSDIDNRLKGIGDLLQAVGLIDDDKNIFGWNAFWTVDLPKGIAAQISITQADALREAA